MNRDKAQTTRVLNSLLESGFTDKATNPNDQRGQFLVPTQASKETLLKIDGIEQQVATILPNLS